MVYTQFGMVDTYWALIVPRIVNGSIFGIFLLRAFFAGLPEEFSRPRASTEPAVSP